VGGVAHLRSTFYIWDFLVSMGGDVVDEENEDDDDDDVDEGSLGLIWIVRWMTCDPRLILLHT